MFIAILRLGEVADLSVHCVRADRRDIFPGELISLTDQFPLVGVCDAPVRLPDLEPHDLVVEDPLPHDPVESCQGGGVAGEELLRHERANDSAPDEARRLA